MPVDSAHSDPILVHKRQYFEPVKVDIKRSSLTSITVDIDNQSGTLQSYFHVIMAPEHVVADDQ